MQVWVEKVEAVHSLLKLVVLPKDHLVAITKLQLLNLRYRWFLTQCLGQQLQPQLPHQLQCLHQQQQPQFKEKIRKLLSTLKLTCLT